MSWTFSRVLRLIPSSTSMDFSRRLVRGTEAVIAVLTALVVSRFVGFGDDAFDAAFDAVAPESSFRRCNSAEIPSTTGAQRFVLLVSTMDGYMTVLNGQTGVVQWTLATGSGPLLSSSITNLELVRNGSPSRLVPSLDGGLYHVSEKGIEPVPLSADAMLSSSFRFTDDSMILGAKAIESYGINLSTGKIRYTCSAEGCKSFDDDKINANINDEVLVISRNDKTVRAVELQTGQEKWNFSVGQHDVSYVFQAAQEEPVKSINEGSSVEEDSEHCSIESDGFDEYNYQFESPNFNSFEFDPSDVKLKVMVSTGMVYAMSQSHPGLVYWQHQFETAIASTWILRSGKLSEVDLFNSEIVPTLRQSKGFHDFEMDGGKNTPVLYLGSFNNQLYVQPSVRFIAEMELATEDAVRKGSLIDINMPKVIWRPYLATAASRTPTVASKQPHLQIPSDDNWTKELNDGTSLVKWQDNYPFDEGYYLFPDYTPIHLLAESNRTVFAENYGLLGFFFCSWLRIFTSLISVLSIIVGCSVFIYNKLLKIRDCYASEAQKAFDEIESCVSDSAPDELASPVAADIQCLSLVKEIEKSEKTAEYISRFSSDFQQEACLGRGGFGVVFKAVNRLDDCVYAVKRIALNDSERARQKVMREVKALARLDHPGIVRYYQSWLESPPPGWQEEKDRTSLDASIATPSQDCVASDYSCSVQGRRKDEPLQSCSVADKKLNAFKFSHSFNGSNDLMIANGIPNNFMLSDCSEEEASSRCAKEFEASSGAASASMASDDSLEISFRDEDLKEEASKDGNWSSNSNSCDSPKKAVASNDVSDSLEIIFDDGNEISEQNNIAERGRLSSMGAGSNSEVFSPSSGPERPKLLQLSDQFADSFVGKSHCRAQKLYLYIQMQLCQSQNLKDWLSSNVEDRDRNYLLNVFHQIVRAISYVHKQSLMHRDLKPSNIFFAQDGMIKIGDFGLVTAVEEKCVDEGYVSGSLPGTKHTNQVGTTLYMSPEQSTGGNYTYKVDIYALGMIFFELFYPFHTDMERIRTLQSIRQLNFPEEFVKNCNMEYKFVQPLLSHDPDNRPSTQEILNDAMLTELEEAAEALNRLHSQARQRTTSQSSGNSSGGSSSHISSSAS